MVSFHELGQRLSQEHQAYRAFAATLYTYKHEPKGALAPVAKAVLRAAVEVYIGPLFYAGERFVQGDSPEKIKKNAQEKLEWMRKPD